MTSLAHTRSFLLRALTAAALLAASMGALVGAPGTARAEKGTVQYVEQAKKNDCKTGYRADRPGVTTGGWCDDVDVTCNSDGTCTVDGIAGDVITFLQLPEAELTHDFEDDDFEDDGFEGDGFESDGDFEDDGGWDRAEYEAAYELERGE